MAGVTVVVPTRDRAELLRRTLATVLAQRPVPRLVVVDDGSTDHTADVLATVDARVVRNDGAAWGAARARNEGLAAVDTDLVAFVDSDDLLVPGGLAALAAALAAAPDAPFAHGCGLAAAETGAGWAPEGLIAPLRSELRSPAAALFVRNYVPSSGALVRTARARDAGGFAPLAFSEDHDFWLRLADQGRPVHVPEVVVVHRRHPGNRHDVERARADERQISARRATATGHRAEREGTLLCERTVEALKAHRPAAAVAAWRAHGGSALPVTRAALRHFRRRRLAARAGLVLWEQRADLRDWLAAQSRAQRA